MSIIKLFLFICLIPFLTHAKQKPPKKDTLRKPSQQESLTLYGEAISDDYPIDQFNNTLNAPDNIKKEILNPAERSFVISKAQLYAETQSWDHLEKDILILRAKKYSFEELKKIYPRINPVKLNQLQQILSGK